MFSRNIEKGLFTAATIDNVDHDLFSTRAKCSYHVASVPVYQRNKPDLPHRIFFYENKTRLKVKDTRTLSYLNKYSTS